MKYKPLLILIIFLLPFFFLTNGIKIISVMASEEENIDSFDVNPINRWDQELTTGEETLAVDNGIFTFTDDGDAGESTAYSRLLQDNDFKIEGRIQTPSLTQGPTNFSNIADTAFAGWSAGDGKNPFGNDDGTPVDETDENAVTWTTYGQYQTDNVGVGEPGFAGGWVLQGKTGITNNINKGFLVTGLDAYADYDCNLTMFNQDHPTSSDFKVGIMYRFTNEGSYFSWISIICEVPDDGGAGNLTVYETNSTGYPELIATASYVYPAVNTAWILRAELVIFNLTVSINSVEQYEINNITLTSGKAGIRMKSYDEIDCGFTACSIDTSVSANPQARAIIGLENNENVLNLSQSGAAIVFECSLDNDFENTVQVYYSFYSGTTNYEVFMFNLTRATWYRFEIELDALRSELDFDFETDAGESITNATKSHLQINSIHQPNIFNAFEYKLFWGNIFTQGRQIFSWKIDFLKGPYHESRWKEEVVVNAGRFESINEFGAVATGIDVDLNDFGIFNMVVPSFDSFTGVMYARTNASNEGNMDESNCYSSLRVIGIYANNGTEVEICFISLGFIGHNEAGDLDLSFADARIRIGDTRAGATPIGGPFVIIRDYGGFQNAVEAGFLVHRTSLDNLTIQISLNGENINWQFDMSGFSSEVKLEMFYEFDEDTDDDITRYQIGIKDMQIQERAALKFLPKLPSLSGIVGAIIDFFITPLKVLMRFLAGVLTAGFAFLFGKLEDIFDSLGDLAGGIWDGFIDTIDDIFTGIIDWAGSAVNDILGLFELIGGTIVETIIDPLLGGVITWFLIAIDLWIILVSYFTFIYDTIIEWSPLLYLCLTAYIWIGATAKADDFVGYLVNLTDNMFRDIVGGRFAILGVTIPVPLGLIWGVLSAWFFFKGGIIVLA